LVAKFFQLVSLALIAAILGGTQCGDLCSFLALKRETRTAQALGQEMPCHENHAPQNSQPVNREQCSHHELLAEKRSSDSSANDVQAVSVAVININAHIVPARSSSPLTTAVERSARRSPLALISILRI
jgi:hypothetical protein